VEWVLSELLKTAERRESAQEQMHERPAEEQVVLARERAVRWSVPQDVDGEYRQPL
jgi:hypothetical protein